MFYLICIQGQGYNNVAASSKCSFCSTTEELATRCRGSITVGSFTSCHFLTTVQIPTLSTRKFNCVESTWL